MYRGQCVGRLINILSKIWTVSAAYDCVFSKGDTIFKNHNENEIVATYTWKENTDIPIFTFTEKYAFLSDYQTVLDQFISDYGYLKLDPEDIYVGTTGHFEELVRGTLTDDNEVESKMQKRDKLLLRQKQKEERYLAAKNRKL